MICLEISLGNTLNCTIIAGWHPFPLNCAVILGIASDKLGVSAYISLYTGCSSFKHIYLRRPTTLGRCSPDSSGAKAPAVSLSRRSIANRM